MRDGHAVPRFDTLLSRPPLDLFFASPGGTVERDSRGRQERAPAGSCAANVRADLCGRRDFRIPPERIPKTKSPLVRRAIVQLCHFIKIWSGRRDSNPRPRPWQGRALPLSYTRIREVGGDRRQRAELCQMRAVNATAADGPKLAGMADIGGNARKSARMRAGRVPPIANSAFRGQLRAQAVVE
jgi:hypothetical protein